jgi:putative acetyltransferase
MLYVNKDFQGNGLAKLLLSEIELEAFRLKEPLLISDVSITAKPFFEKSGFQILQEQNVIVQGIEFVNYRMQKSLI